MIANCAALLALCLAYGIGSEEAARGDSPAGVVDEVTAPVKDVLNQATAPVTAPLPVVPAPAPAPSGSTPSAPAKAPIKVPSVPSPSTGSTKSPAAATGAAGTATDAAAGVAEIAPPPVEYATDSLPAASGGGEDLAAPTGSDAAAAPDRSQRTPPGADEVMLGALRLAPIRGWFVHVWPAMALSPAAAGRVLGRLGDGTSGIVSSVLVAFGGGGSAAGGPAGIEAPPMQDAVAVDSAAQVDASSSPLSRWLSSDPPLPFAVFWIGVAGALALLWFVMRRELGLPVLRRR